MEKDPEHFKKLMRRYLDNECTPGEMKELFTIINSADADRLLLKEMQEEFSSAFAADEKIQPSPVRGAEIIPFYRKRWFQIAAAVLIIICSGIYFLPVGKKVKETVKNEIKQPPINSISPGTDMAVLTLSDGQKIILDSTHNGTIAVQGNSKIVKNNNGQIVYDSEARPADTGSTVFNTVVTPRGGQFRVVLPDGTNVWLNAASSVRFPVQFTGGERKVEISGEAYFEVVKNAAKPFKVILNGSEEIQVLGTHFNVMAYKDEESIKTTLLEGSVKITNGGQVSLLKPGQQAVTARDGKTVILSNVDTDHEIAWKNGLFDFDNDNLQEIMRQLSRWYNVEVIYSGEIPSGHYVGSVRRQAGITQVLKMLELAGNARFSVMDKKIVVKEN